MLYPVRHVFDSTDLFRVDVVKHNLYGSPLVEKTHKYFDSIKEVRNYLSVYMFTIKGKGTLGGWKGKKTGHYYFDDNGFRYSFHITGPKGKIDVISN